MDYRMGLDIGVTSVGWAVLENDSKGEPKRIVDLGVRIFDAAENPQDGSSLATPRREARSTRRRLRRRKHRMERLKKLMEQKGLIQLDQYQEKYNKKGDMPPDVYRLRYEALERILTGEELAQVLLHIAKHRGFQSNRRAELKEDEGGRVLKALGENEQIMAQGQYRTVGEMLYLDDRFKMSAYGEGGEQIYNTRNHGGDYRHTIKRSLLTEEVNIIFEKQRELGSSIAGEEFREEYLEIMLSQRSFDEGPGLQPDGSPSPYGGDMIDKMVGCCTLEPEERRAAKACFTAERFVMAQKLSHLRMRDKRGEFISLAEYYSDLQQMAYQQKKVTYAAIRRKLGLSLDYLFADLSYSGEGSREEAIKKAEKAVCIQLPYFHAIREALGNYDVISLYDEVFVERLDAIGNILTKNKSDDCRRAKLEQIGVIPEQVERLLECNPSKFQHLSLKAMKKLIPYLEQGLTYDKACKAAGYDFKAEYQGEKLHLLKGKEITSIINEIPNPVVKRAVSQTFKVINAIIIKYGSPQAIHIELARDISKKLDERKKLQKRQEDNRREIERAKLQIKELGIIREPRDSDVTKFRLWKEQGECCMYSGKLIPIDKLFESKYAEVDHIIPYSKSFDNSYSNKVLVLTQENQNKGNRLPYEAFGENKAKWGDFEERIRLYVKDYRKQRHLLKQHLTEDDIRAFKERNINDTRYITSSVMDVLQNYLEFAPYEVEGRIRRVIPVNGRITNFLRVRWGLEKKDRSADTHHAEDAVLVACCTSNMVKKITRNLQAKEVRWSRNIPVVDEDTGRTFYRKDYSDEGWIQLFGKNITPPWAHFLDELNFRMSPAPELFIQNCPKEYGKFGYPEGEEEKIHPVFVSRMPRHKVSGTERADTIRSPRHFQEQGIVLTKVPLTDLKYKDGKIQNYYQPETDRLLYRALCDRLEEYGGNAKEAFKEDFYKPKSDGSKGPLVRKVKVWEKMTLGVLVNNGRGIANNGDMIRVDVFQEEQKYYFVPIYVADVKKKELPNRAVVGAKPYSKWKEIREEDFLFSLYPNDLFYFERKNGNKRKANQKESYAIDKQICYFKGADISTASFYGILHDNSDSFRGLGIQTLEKLKKFQVSVLGELSEVRREKRMHFRS